MAQLKDTLVTGDLRVTGTIYNDRLTTLENKVDTNTNDISAIQSKLVEDEETLASHTTNINTNTNDISAIQSYLADFVTYSASTETLTIGKFA